jgi:transcription elongation factor S-II
MAATDVKDLLEIAKQLTKAMESGDPSSTILTLMKPLESVKVTEDSLRRSKIGVAVTRVRTANKDPKIGELAGKLVNKWKQEVSRQKAAAAGGSPAAAVKASGASTNGAQATSSPAPTAKTNSDPRKDAPKDRPKVDIEKRNTTTDEINFKLTGEPARDGCIKLMYDGIAYMSEHSPSDILKVAQAIETAAYNHFNSSTSAEYKAQIRSLFQNLKMKPNASLRQDVFSGAIPPQKFVAMTTEDLKSAEKKAEDEALEKENMNAAMTAKEEKAISTTMQCGKCKAFKVSYSQAQTRSADEPLTTFCECVSCGHRWKFS